MHKACFNVSLLRQQPSSIAPRIECSTMLEHTGGSLFSCGCGLTPVIDLSFKANTSWVGMLSPTDMVQGCSLFWTMTGQSSCEATLLVTMFSFAFAPSHRDTIGSLIGMLGLIDAVFEPPHSSKRQGDTAWALTITEHQSLFALRSHYAEIVFQQQVAHQLLLFRPMHVEVWPP